MATDTKRGSSQASQDYSAGVSVTASGPGGTGGGPAGPDDGSGSAKPLVTTAVYFDRRGGKKRKRNRRKKYTKGTKAPQRLVFGESRATYRVANAFSRGLRTFVRRSNRSARRRKDGFVRYSLRNASRGFNTALKELGRAPEEITNRIGTRNVRRAFRLLTNPFSR
jgi:hypothetical protein